MKTLIRIEELGIFGLSIILFAQTTFAWWWFPLLLLAPDISMVGYLANPRIGAAVYNLFHHKAVAVGCIIAGYLLSMPWAGLAGIIMLGHAAMDRLLGFGLKYPDSFHHTHLGQIGQY
ncbi:DUF4260 domain-containing protein [Fodinibius sediminis]|uniref:DUF4260 domain-containing protein n=1 Tax=Fodinibius sediminis TaxID=1214077 RepID=A0A521E5R8_9BACT|nr:DUF4260 domain-containing protein [Fodinibius sediminis]SMO79296.1 protein of unknown function [Fodinibius sediminis]